MLLYIFDILSLFWVKAESNEQGESEIESQTSQNERCSVIEEFLSYSRKGVGVSDAPSILQVSKDR